MESVEVAVVGAGVMGAAAAWALGRAGVDAIVLEQHTVGHDRGSSHGATRIFRFAYDDPYYVGLAQQSLPLWRELEQASGRSLLAITGGLDFGSSDYLSSSAAALRTRRAAADILSASEVRSQWPGLDFGGESALWSPDTGVLAAGECVKAMLAASGVPVRTGVRASIELDGDDAIVAGSVRARRVVLAAGGWTGPMLEPLGVTLPLQVTREQVFYFPLADGEVPVVIERAAFLRYVVPPVHGAPGAKAGEHGTGERTTADGRSDAIDPEGEARVCDWVTQSFPALDPQPVAAETCLYTITPDDDFVIGSHGPVVYASPCSGHGFKFAPLIGEILAAIALDKPPPADISRFAPARFF